MADIPTRDLSEKKLGFALWFTSHQLFLNKFLIGFLIFLNVIFYGVVIKNVFSLFILDRGRHRVNLYALTQNNLDYSVINSAVSARELEFSAAQTLDGGLGKKDVVVRVFNPNNNFFAKSVEYELLSGSTIVQTGNTYIYPGQEKYIVAYGLDSSQLGDISLRILNIKWTRTSGEFLKISESVRNFRIFDVKFSPVSNSAYTQAFFHIANESVYSFWGVDVHLNIFQGERLVAVGFTRLENIDPKEEQEISYTWFFPSSPTSRLRVEADVNILDDSNFKRFEAGSGEIK